MWQWEIKWNNSLKGTKYTALHRNKMEEKRKINKNDRTVIYSVEVKPCKISLINLYAYIEQKKIECYGKVYVEFENISKEDALIVLRDLNAHTRKVEY